MNDLKFGGGITNEDTIDVWSRKWVFRIFFLIVILTVLFSLRVDFLFHTNWSWSSFIPGLRSFIDGILGNVIATSLVVFFLMYVRPEFISKDFNPWIKRTINLTSDVKMSLDCSSDITKKKQEDKKDES